MPGRRGVVVHGRLRQPGPRRRGAAIGLPGLLDVSDQCFLDTVTAVERELRVGPTVFRYRYDDGLPGLEGGFHICTTLLIEAYVAVGRIEETWDLFDQLVNVFGPTGLLPEEYDPGHRISWGQPSAGVFAPGFHPLRAAAGRTSQELAVIFAGSSG